MNGLDKSDVHTCMAKWLISWGRTSFVKVNHKIVVKLNTGCVQNVVTTLNCGLCWPCLGTDTEDFFFQEPINLPPPGWYPWSLLCRLPACCIKCRYETTALFQQEGGWCVPGTPSPFEETESFQVLLFHCQHSVITSAKSLPNVDMSPCRPKQCIKL